MILTLFSLVYLFQPSNAGELPVGVPQLIVQKGDKNPSTVSELAYEIEVLGFLAQTTVTMEITDPDLINQEATLWVRLPAHSMVDGFQLRIGATMVDGVVQEKHLARIGFEREKRKRVDPGLIEWMGPDLYRIRVYPLHLNLPRRLSFTYLAPLEKQGREDVYQLDFSSLAKETQLKVGLLQRDGATAPSISGLAMEPDKQLQSGLQWTGQSGKPVKESLIVRWQEGQRASAMVASDEGSWHFALQSPLVGSQGRLLPKPDEVVVLWDASHSRGSGPLAKEIDALFRLIAYRNPGSLTLIPFRDRLQSSLTFPLSTRGKKALRETLDQMVYDGGTNLRGLVFPPEIRADEIWLFTDGQDSLGLPQKIAFHDIPTFAFSASKAAQRSYLETLHEDHSVKAVFWDNPEEQVLDQVFSQAQVGFESIIPARGHLLAAHATMATATRTLLAGGETSEYPKKFYLHLDDGKRQALSTLKDVSQDPVAITWMKRFRFGRELQQWEREPDYFREEILDLGDMHGLVTPHTTLIVFETLWQYEINGLVPPANAPFAGAKMTDRTPDVEKLKRRKEEYFSKLAKLWKTRAFKKSNAQNSKPKADLRQKASRDAAHGRVLTVEELEALPQARDPWAVLKTIPAIQADRINIGGNESYLTWGAFDQAGFTTGGNGESLSGSNHDARALGLPGTDGNGDRGTRPIVLPWNKIKKAIAQLKAVSPSEAYDHYVSLKPTYGASPSFYYQSAHYFAELGEADLARQIASNLLELNGGDDRLLVAVGMLFHVLEALDLAEAVYQKLAKNRPEWPQARMLLAQIQRERAVTQEKTDPQQAIAAYRQAFEIYQKVITAPWGELDLWDQADFLRENRFPYVTIQALEEAFWIQVRLAKLGEKVEVVLPESMEASPEDIRSDLRVLLWWDDENADLDLWITEPKYRQVNYQTDSSRTGLQILDQRDGFGPDSYRQNSGIPGEFTISAKYYGNVFSRLTGPIYAKAEIWTRYGYPDEAYGVELKRIEPDRRGVGVRFRKLTLPNY